MILTCPACATRYQADEAKFPSAGRQVRCAKCGNVWHQAGPDAAPPPAAGPEPGLETPQPESEAPQPESLAGFRAGIGAASASTPSQEPRKALWPLVAVALGWIGLIAVVLLIGLSAVRYRQEVTVIWPQSAGVYSKLGMDVNIQGIDFTHVNYLRQSEDGQVVLAVTGRIINNGARELPVPQNMRVTLSDAGNHELYHWNFPSPVQSLRPGRSASFATRLSSPPAAARHLEVRFAK